MSKLTPDVLWEEGMALLPHNLQQTQRCTQGMIARMANMRAFSYGVRHLVLREEGVRNWIVDPECCDVVMPDGTLLVLGENARLRPVEFRHVTGEDSRLDVWLALPLYDAAGANTTVDGAEERGSPTHARFIAITAEENDENTGRNKKAMQVRFYDARIFVGTRPETGYSSLKIAELTKAEFEGEEGSSYELSKDFAPASLSIEAAPPIHTLLVDLLHELEAKNQELLDALKGDIRVQDQGTLEDPTSLLRLQATNGILPILRQLVAQPLMHPFDVYLYLVRLIGDLAVFSDWEPPELPAYDHDDPMVSFKDLKENWRRMLKKAIDARRERRKFTESQTMPGVLDAEVPPYFLNDGVELYLGVETKATGAEVHRLFDKGNTPLAAPERVNRFTTSSSPITCHLDSVHPSLRALDGFVFLRLDLESEEWGHVRQAKLLGMRGLAVAQPDMGFTLFAVNLPPKR